MKTFYSLGRCRQLLIAALLGLGSSGDAAELKTVEGLKAIDFKLIKRPVRIPERGEVTGFLWLVDGRGFSFLPPHGWQVRGNPEEKQIVLSPRDMAASISLKLVPANSAGGQPRAADGLREGVEQRYPDARVKEQFEFAMRDGSATVFDLERLGANGARLFLRLVFVPRPDWVLECTLAAPSARSEEFHFALGNLLSSLTSEKIVGLPRKSGS